MKSEHPHSSLHDAVLGRIRDGGVSMRPRWFFILRAALIGVGIVLVALTLFFAVSLMLFALRLSGVWFVPAFGLKGLGVFLWALPSLLMLFTVMFIVLLEVLVRHYTIAYRGPLLYSALAILALASLGGFVLAQSSFHRTLLLRAEGNRLPLVGGFYKQYGDPQVPDVHAGKIIEFTAREHFFLQTRHGNRLGVVTNNETRFLYGPELELGDFVVVFGKNTSGTIEALGVRRAVSPVPMFDRIPPPLFIEGR